MSKQPPVDWMARRIVVASLLYYRHDVAMMPDGDFDKLCQRCADNWVWLSPLRKFMLVSASDIRSTGQGVRVTTAVEGGALAWCRANNQQFGDAGRITRWRWSERHSLHWSYIA